MLPRVGGYLFQMQDQWADSMSLYADYLKERTADKIVETEHGFATYRYLDADTVYIIDLYIIPDYRRSHKANDIADSIVEMAKLRGCNKLLGTVVPSSNGATNSVKVLLAYGMKLKSSANDVIFFEKDI